MATEIFPSENDVSATSNGGRVPTEATLSAWRQGFANPYIQLRIDNALPGGVDQFVSSSGAIIGGWDDLGATGLNQDFANGVAFIEGYRVEMDADTVTLTANSWNNIYLQLTKSGGLATGVQLVNVVTTEFDDIGTPPSDAILLWVIETGLSTVATRHDYRPYASGMVAGRYIGNGAAVTHLIDLGFKPKMVMIQKVTPPRITAWSDVGFPIETAINFGPSILEPTNGDPGFVKISADDWLRPRLTAQGFDVGGTAQAFTRREWKSATETWNAGNVASDSVATNSFTISGAAIGDPVIVAPADNRTLQQIVIEAQVTAANTITAKYYNPSPSSIAMNGDLTVWCYVELSTTIGINLNGDEYFWVAWS